MPSGKFRVSIAHVAKADFEDILVYTEQQWGATQADSYADTLDQALRSLSGEADKGCNLEGTEFLFIRAGKHRIFYRVYGHNVKVVRILHAKMDFETHLG